eukprot:356323-Chlamydomonas_euryale.AAC.6
MKYKEVGTCRSSPASAQVHVRRHCGRPQWPSSSHLCGLSLGAATQLKRVADSVPKRVIVKPHELPRRLARGTEHGLTGPTAWRAQHPNPTAWQLRCRTRHNASGIHFFCGVHLITAGERRGAEHASGSASEVLPPRPPHAGFASWNRMPAACTKRRCQSVQSTAGQRAGSARLPPRSPPGSQRA